MRQWHTTNAAQTHGRLNRAPCGWLSLAGWRAGGANRPATQALIADLLLAPTERLAAASALLGVTAGLLPRDEASARGC